MSEDLTEPSIVLKFEGTNPQTWSLSLRAAKATAARLLDAITKARPGERITMGYAEGDAPRMVELSLKEATDLCDALCDGIPKVEAAGEESRRAAGYGPRTEELHLVNDAQGNIVAARKTLRY